MRCTRAVSHPCITMLVAITAPPERLAGSYDLVQFTLVDCPGHASLIRTIIGGAQIIDMMILVIDVVKGIQTQTAEVTTTYSIRFDAMRFETEWHIDG